MYGHRVGREHLEDMPLSLSDRLEERQLAIGCRRPTDAIVYHVVGESLQAAQRGL